MTSELHHQRMISRIVAWGSMLLFAAFVCSAAPTQGKGGGKISYKGHRVLRVVPSTADDVHAVYKLVTPHDDVEVWGEAHMNHSVDLRVGPSSYQRVTTMLKLSAIPYEVEIEDLQSLIEHENDDEAVPSVHRSSKRRYRRWSSGNQRPRAASYFYWFSVVGRYATYSEIKDWLYYATYAWPRIAQIIQIGDTYESRPMLVLKIGKPTKRVKPAIWIDGGFHAREWISPAVVCYLIHVLLDGYGTKRNVTQLVDTYDWYFLPVANPDGYEYSHSVDRLWRKTRSRPEEGSGRRCNGVDLNRNFDYHWKGHCDPLFPEYCPSVNPCGSSYAGPKPFSESEARNIANFVYRRRDLIKLYLSLHSYSQMWLTPWGYTEKKPTDINKLMKLAETAVTAMKQQHGTEYVYGTPADLLYTAGGGSFDWAKGAAGITHAYAVELRDRGRYGFLLPAGQIIPTGEEMWQGIQAVAWALLEDLKEEGHDGDDGKEGGGRNRKEDGDQHHGRSPPTHGRGYVVVNDDEEEDYVKDRSTDEDEEEEDSDPDVQGDARRSHHEYKISVADYVRDSVHIRAILRGGKVNDDDSDDDDDDDDDDGDDTAASSPKRRGISSKDMTPTFITASSSDRSNEKDDAKAETDDATAEKDTELNDDNSDRRYDFSSTRRQRTDSAHKHPRKEHAKKHPHPRNAGISTNNGPKPQQPLANSQANSKVQTPRGNSSNKVQDDSNNLQPHRDISELDLNELRKSQFLRLKEAMAKRRRRRRRRRRQRRMRLLRKS